MLRQSWVRHCHFLRLEHIFTLVLLAKQKFELKAKTTGCHLCKTFSFSHFRAISFFSPPWPTHTLQISAGPFPTLCQPSLWVIKMMVNYQMARHTFAQLPQLARFTHWFLAMDGHGNPGKPPIQLPCAKWKLEWAKWCDGLLKCLASLTRSSSATSLIIINYIISRMDGHLLSPDSIWLWDWDSARPLQLRPRKSTRRWNRLGMAQRKLIWHFK